MARIPPALSSYSEISIQKDVGTGMRPTCFADGEEMTGPSWTQTVP